MVRDAPAEEVLFTESEAETMALGKKLAAHLSAGDVVATIGELGSGKTRLIQGICTGLGVTQEVTSPTFTLINEYRGRLPVYHFDFYRITSQEEVWRLGFEEYWFGDGISLIEWADKVSELLPSDRVTITLKSFFAEGYEHRRRITIQGGIPPLEE